MSAALPRSDLPNDLVALIDALLERLRLVGSSGRVELEYRRTQDGDRRLTKLRRHEEFSRSELAALGGR